MKNIYEGFLAVDKPVGITSFSTVAAVRYRLGGVKAGHAGTLDPAASGLLMLALGSATRLLPFISLEPKRYLFGVRFGSQTDTLDSDGNVVKSGGNIPVKTMIESTLHRFTGVISQVPPDFSAVKVDGMRAYKLARQGRRIELSPRTVQIFSLSLITYDEKTALGEFDVSCSGGTYVRSLARDIAASLGTFGYASSVRRLAAGCYHVSDALAFNMLDKVEEKISSLDDALKGSPRITVDAAQKRELVRGKNIICGGIDSIKDPNPMGVVFAFDNDNNFVAVLKKNGNASYHPIKVFIKR